MFYSRLGLDGLPEEVAAIASSSGAGDANKLVRTSDDGTIHPSLLGNAAQPQRTANAAEALSAGDYVYINSSGLVAKAIATAATTLATGFVLASAASGASVTVYFEGINTALSGLTRNKVQFLSSTTPGARTETPPASGSGHYVQSLGTSNETTATPFKPITVIKRSA